MPSACVVDRIHDGQQALRTSRWDDARAAFEDALAADDTPDARDGLGQALWFQSHVAEGIAARERAFEGYARERRCDEAARVAVWISHQYSIAGAGPPHAGGWRARSGRWRLSAACAGHGWVAVERARHAENLEESAEHARRAMRIARESGAADLEAFALSLLGRAQVSAGRRDAGMALLPRGLATPRTHVDPARARTPIGTGVTSTEASADATQVQRSKPPAARPPAELGLLRPGRRLLDEAISQPHPVLFPQLEHV